MKWPGGTHVNRDNGQFAILVSQSQCEPVENPARLKYRLDV